MSSASAERLKLGLPKGSLQAATFDLMQRAGFTVAESGRSYFPASEDPELEVVLFRAQEMSRYVADGVMDAGITGRDWILENGTAEMVVEVGELNYSKRTSGGARWVLAVPAESPVQDPGDLAGGIVATELVNTTRAYFARRGIDCRVEFSYGATEAKARLVDAIVELTETGSSLRANNLRIIDTVIETTTRLIANRSAWADPWKREKIDSLALLLKGAIDARGKVGLKMNVPTDRLERVVAMLPALRQPTVSPLAQEGWYAVETVTEQGVTRRLIPQLKRAGAEGIIEYALTKVIE
jgi:ATP phosphoribosyltransferase